MASFFRRRLQGLHKQTGTAGLIVAIMALVVALAGGAIAASGGSGDNGATASAKGKQGPRGKQGKQGKPGKPGATGPAGPAGAVGPAGPQGPAGAKGDTGDPGADGDDGADGATGPEGPAGATGFSGFTEKLPAGKTETGAWRFSSDGDPLVPISFPIPLSVEDAASFVEASIESLPKGSAPTANCPGSAANPMAEPGFICIYTSSYESTAASANPFLVLKIPATAAEEASPGEGAVGVSPSGALLFFEEAAAGKTGTGSFAITAPTP